MYKNVLIPVDGSQGSLRAVDYCIELAKSIEIERIMLLHVAALPGRLSYSGKLGRIYFNIKDQLEEYGEELLAELKNKFTENNVHVPVETKLEIADPAHTIVQVAKEGKYDLVIVGSRGLSGIEGMLMGSVSSHVANNVRCTVIVVREKID